MYRTSKTNQPMGQLNSQTSWTDQLSLFEALASSHIRRFQFLLYRSFQVRWRPCCKPKLVVNINIVHLSYNFLIKFYYSLLLSQQRAKITENVSKIIYGKIIVKDNNHFEQQWKKWKLCKGHVLHDTTQDEDIFIHFVSCWLSSSNKSPQWNTALINHVIQGG